MSQPHFIIGRKGATYPRLAIEDLQSQKPDQFFLFILSYLIIQERELPQSIATLSGEAEVVYNAYNQISISGLPGSAAMKFADLAGIHGLPYEAWQGDPDHDGKADYNSQDLKDMGPKPARFGGRSISKLAPALRFGDRGKDMQSICKVADGLAQRLDDSGTFKNKVWKDASKELRFPFWDWSDIRVVTKGLPEVLYEEEITLKISTQEITIPNPISYYTFKKIPYGFRDITDPDTGETAYYSKWMRTLLFTLPTGEDDSARACQTYDEFSNHTVQSTNKLHYYDADSLEGIHDSMHDILGGNGHMSNPDYAGFDPIFFLHHCNVDRLYALWEYVYPKECYIGNGADYVFTQNRGTYALVYNSMVLGETELAPFRLGDGKYWTTDHARRLDKFAYNKYYTYPEVCGIKVDQPATDEERARYRTALQEYYEVGNMYNVSLELNNQIIRALPRRNPAFDGTLATIPNAIHIVIGIQTPEFAFNGPYSIRMHYPAGSGDSKYIGSFSVLTRQDESNCASCKKRRNMGSSVHGIIPVPKDVIADVIESLGTLASTGSDSPVIDRLKKSLQAKIVDFRGKELARAQGGSSDVKGNALDRAFAPTITLASANVVRHQDQHSNDSRGPIQWHNWASHGDIFEPELDSPGWGIVTA
ncbi:hypothetical protein VKT23_006148 [Stygiomarasmius scandens]|uniref:tyrosinase n=1 Tax=Marasmiellus scandens TaxID=2682957 RepID=A0ABR1JU26_9AGAR